MALVGTCCDTVQVVVAVLSLRSVQQQAGQLQCIATICMYALGAFKVVLMQLDICFLCAGLRM